MNLYEYTDFTNTVTVTRSFARRQVHSWSFLRFVFERLCKRHECTNWSIRTFDEWPLSSKNQCHCTFLNYFSFMLSSTITLALSQCFFQDEKVFFVHCLFPLCYSLVLLLLPSHLNPILTVGSHNHRVLLCVVPSRYLKELSYRTMHCSCFD